MLDRLSRAIDRFANWKATLILLALLIPFNAFLFPQRSARFRQLSGEANPVLDTQFAYTPQEAFRIVSNLGPEGRQLYIQTELTVDLIYPILYTTLSCLLLAQVFRRAFHPGSRWQKLVIIPYLMLLADYAENLGLALLLATYPRQPVLLAQIASFFTSTKWFMAGVSLLLLGIGLLSWGLRAVGWLGSRPSK